MNSMFPGHGRRDGGHDAGGGAADKNYRPGPRDYNRPVHNITQDQDLSTWPHPLRWAYWVLVVAAVIMLVSGMVGIFGGGGVQVEPSDSRIAEYVRSNRLFVSAFNIIGAIILALFSAQLATGSKWARRIISVVIAITLFFNIAALARGIGGLGLLFIAVTLLIAVVLLFRPQSNRFIAHRSLHGRN